MAGTLNAFDAAVSIKTIMGTDLPTKLDALDTAYNDSITLDDIAQWYLAPLARYDALPCGIIIPSGTQKPDEYRGEVVVFHLIDIHIVHHGNTKTAAYLPQELTSIKLARTCRGIQEVLEANETLTISSTDNADHLLVQGVDFSDTFTDGENFRRDALMSVQIIASI